MHFTREQRDSWAAETQNSAFNEWVRERVSDRAGRLDLSALHRLAGEYGIDASIYSHLNPGQQRMNVGNRLRKLVPAEVYSDQSTSIQVEHRPITAPKLTKVSRADQLPIFEGATDRFLIQLYGAVIDELRARKVIRTANAPLGDYAEHLFAKAFGWSLEANSSSGYDATDDQHIRYQIKARRLRSNAPGERQLSVIRALPEKKFDVLAAVLFDSSFNVHRAVLVPHDVVLKRSRYISHVNGWRMILDESVWKEPGVDDVTCKLSEQSPQPAVKSVTLTGETGAANWAARAIAWLRTR